jgi:hypothetical protein
MKYKNTCVSMSADTIKDFEFIKSHTGAGPSGTIRALAKKEVERIVKEKEGK